MLPQRKPTLLMLRRSYSNWQVCCRIKELPNMLYTPANRFYKGLENRKFHTKWKIWYLPDGEFKGQMLICLGNTGTSSGKRRITSKFPEWVPCETKGKAAHAHTYTCTAKPVVLFWKVVIPQCENTALKIVSTYWKCKNLSIADELLF